MSGQIRQQLELILIGLVLLFAVGGGVTYQRMHRSVRFSMPTSSSAPHPSVGRTFDYGRAFSTGASEAPVTILEFSDFECPFCRAFAHAVQPELLKQFVNGGRVKWVFKNFPVPELHPNAATAAAAAVCAGDQGRFWEMHGALFALAPRVTGGPKASNDIYERTAATLGLGFDQFEHCMQRGDAAGRVKRDHEDAERLGILGTPTFVVGRTLTTETLQVSKIITGISNISTFSEAIAEAGRSGQQAR